jgi:hypothetical protein
MLMGHHVNLIGLTKFNNNSIKIFTCEPLSKLKKLKMCSIFVVPLLPCSLSHFIVNWSIFFFCHQFFFSDHFVFIFRCFSIDVL